MTTTPPRLAPFLDPELPLFEIVWWVSKELLFRAGEAWFIRDLYAYRR